MNKTWQHSLERSRWWLRWRDTEAVLVNLSALSSSLVSGSRIIEFAPAE